MAQANLPASRPPEFPQPTIDFNFVSRAAGLKAIDPEPHSGRCIDSLLALVDEVSVRAAAIADHVPVKTDLEDCQFQEEGWPCYHPGVVHHLASDRQFCRVHFRAVCRG